MTETYRDEIGRFLEETRGELIERWSRETKRKNPELERLPEASVINAMGLFVDQVAAALRARHGLSDSSIAQSHGEHRQANAFELHRLIGEYVTFLDVVRDTAAAHGRSLDAKEQLRLARLVLIGAAESTHAFATRHERALRRRDAEHFAFLAHDLRNPLAVVRMAWQLLRAQGQLPESEPVRLIERSLVATVERLDTSLESMRARLDFDGTVLDRDRHQLGALVSAACDEVALAARTKQVEIEIGGGDEVELQVDGRLISAALINVLHNAIKHTPSGGRVVVTWQTEQETAIVEICDEGTGIDPETAERIFKAFSAGSGEGSGFGLGLAIVREAVEAHGGSVHLENRNEPDRGCCFKLLVPLPGAQPITVSAREGA